MNYIAKHTGGKLSNDPYIITYDDIRRMYDENLCDAAECESVTQSSYRGESFYSNEEDPVRESFRIIEWLFLRKFSIVTPKPQAL